MKQKNTRDNSQTAQNSRDDRLKAALKANMAKRKAQTKARVAGKTAEVEDKGKT